MSPNSSFTAADSTACQAKAFHERHFSFICALNYFHPPTPVFLSANFKSMVHIAKSVECVNAGIGLVSCPRMTPRYPHPPTKIYSEPRSGQYCYNVHWRAGLTTESPQILQSFLQNIIRVLLS